jgi:predicted nucleotide-binding protein
VATLFIGSSVEGLPIARSIQTALRHDKVTVTIWTDGVFQASQAAIESLELAVRASDFAALVLSPDDKVVVRGKEHDAPRDNVVFELGLFMGALGRERTFVVRPRGVTLKIPTDLMGVNDLAYAQGVAADLDARIGPIGNDIRKCIEKLGPR